MWIQFYSYFFGENKKSRFKKVSIPTNDFMICFSMKILSMDKRLNFSLIFEQPTNYFTDIDRLNIFSYFFGKIKKPTKDIANRLF